MGLVVYVTEINSVGKIPLSDKRKNEKVGLRV